jgi:3-hydroxymyristoyl/3-hydroxydecanoyl-(acyl carrier protein) dehydratase
MTLREVIAHARRGAQEFQFDATEPFFAGHFPGQSILPGIFQLEMARLLAEEELKQPVIIRAIRKAKFQRPIRPGETVRLQLKLSEDGDGFLAHARFFVGEQPAGETQLRLGKP